MPNEKEVELKNLLIEADSMIGHLSHRCGIKWNDLENINQKECDDLCWKLRMLYENPTPAQDKGLVPLNFEEAEKELYQVELKDIDTEDPNIWWEVRERYHKKLKDICAKFARPTFNVPSVDDIENLLKKDFGHHYRCAYITEEAETCTCDIRGRRMNMSIAIHALIAGEGKA